jgi:hypothetical protein
MVDRPSFCLFVIRVFKNHNSWRGREDCIKREEREASGFELEKLDQKTFRRKRFELG